MQVTRMHTCIYIIISFQVQLRWGFAMKHGGGADFRLLQETEFLLGSMGSLGVPLAWHCGTVCNKTVKQPSN